MQEHAQTTTIQPVTQHSQSGPDNTGPLSVTTPLERIDIGEIKAK